MLIWLFFQLFVIGCNCYNPRVDNRDNWRVYSDDDAFWKRKLSTMSSSYSMNDHQTPWFITTENYQLLKPTAQDDDSNVKKNETKLNKMTNGNNTRS
mmetsp:Transcript_5667/g.8348  ORF Transcript_5667/g.8348 Transcript_5667/m.8348 type:complete len:97 (+) Transcript_5667:47-337(+)